MSDNKNAAFLPLGIGVGLAIGVALGMALDNLALGLALGVAIGSGVGVVGMASGKPKKKDGDGSAGVVASDTSERAPRDIDTGDGGGDGGGGGD